MVAENPTWGAPRIHGELKMLGFDISGRTVLRWMRETPRIQDVEQIASRLKRNRSVSRNCRRNVVSHCLAP
jgi:hypothetical protein